MEKIIKLYYFLLVILETWDNFNNIKNEKAEHGNNMITTILAVFDHNSKIVIMS